MLTYFVLLIALIIRLGYYQIVKGEKSIQGRLISLKPVTASSARKGEQSMTERAGAGNKRFG